MKKIIRLTENDLHKIIKESVKRIIKENDYGSYDIDNSSTEEEKCWWSPQYGYNNSPNGDGIWCFVTLNVEYDYSSDGQMTDFGWHEDGDSTPTSCQVSDMIIYQHQGGKLINISNEIDDDEYNNFVSQIENSYLK